MKLLVQIYTICFPALWTLSSIDDSDLRSWVPYLAVAMAILDLVSRRSVKSPALLLAVVTVIEAARHGESIVIWYPVVANAALFSIFLASFRSETIVERIASRKEVLSEHARQYCRTVTMVWCCFFVLNGCVALYTVFVKDMALWGFYNGFVSYCLIAIVFTVEYVIRRRVTASRLMLPLLIILSIALRSSASVSAETLNSLTSVVRIMTGESQLRTPIRFHQYRTLKGLTKPIVSQGTLAINPGRELIWEIESPMQATVRITAEGIQESVDGVSGKILTSLFHTELAKLLLLLHGGSLNDIERGFESRFTSDSAGYTVTLKPKRKMVRKALSSIEIQGSCYPRRISIQFAGGDSVKIEFESKDSPCAPE